MDKKKTVLENIKSYYPKMFAAEKKVAKFILDNPEKAVMTNVSELAKLSGVSDATVIRMCKRVGYQGYYQMKIILSNDLGKRQFKNLKKGNKRPDTIKELFQLFASNLFDIANNLNVEILFDCIELIKKADIVHIVAAGNTAPIANDLGFRLERFGIRATYSMVSEYFLNHVSLAGENDIVFAISRSGSSKQVVQAMELAKEKKLKTIALTEYEYSPVSSLADYLLLTKVNNPVFLEYAPDSHLAEMAVIDTLLYFLTNEDTLRRSDTVELMLSEYKL